MSRASSPHDAVFRQVLGQRVNAASQLAATLPKALVERLDLARLTPVPASFVDTDLRWRHSDLLFTAPLGGREAFVYLLIEHQSSEDKLMPFRMLHYLVRIWDRYLTEHPNATSLPAIIPLVVHHNRRSWRGSTQLRDLFDLDPETTETVREYLPYFRFLLDDLAAVDEQALRDRPVTPPVRVTLLLLKIASGNRWLAQDLGRWADQLQAVVDRQGGLEDFKSLLRYIELVGEATTDELHQLAVQLGPQAEEAFMTTAEKLRAEGRAEGEARGEARGRAGLLLQQMRLKFGPVPPAAVEALHGASADQLEAWAGRILTANTLDEVLS